MSVCVLFKYTIKQCIVINIVTCNKHCDICIILTKACQPTVIFLADTPPPHTHTHPTHPTLMWIQVYHVNPLSYVIYFWLTIPYCIFSFLTIACQPIAIGSRLTNTLIWSFYIHTICWLITIGVLSFTLIDFWKIANIWLHVLRYFIRNYIKSCRATYKSRGSSRICSLYKIYIFGPCKIMQRKKCAGK